MVFIVYVHFTLSALCGYTTLFTSYILLVSTAQHRIERSQYHISVHKHHIVISVSCLYFVAVEMLLLISDGVVFGVSSNTQTTLQTQLTSTQSTLITLACDKHTMYASSNTVQQKKDRAFQ
jgi:hypothetical protein